MSESVIKRIIVDLPDFELDEINAYCEAQHLARTVLVRLVMRDWLRRKRNIEELIAEIETATPQTN